ncbi:unnamed protein product [Callosobruchus maculatus]|uniref:Uncharacterized protein n=1 Tax=Callosobruchus maculatus TaxID=64391 RepID=A0A653BXD6_CALMS|nr:unnamed protein product [Callosobruchus maculatus]
MTTRHFNKELRASGAMWLRP